MNCTVCAHAEVSTIDTLLASGSSIRAVSRMFGCSRSALARHKQHAQVMASKLAVIAGRGGSDGTGGSLDPLAEALALSRRARTDRELLRAAEAVRSATALAVRALRSGESEEMLSRLDSNIAEAEMLYRRVGGFENELRALAGHREAVRQRVEAVGTEETVETAFTVSFFNAEEGPPSEDEEPFAPPGRMFRVSVAEYFAGIPSRFHDVDRYEVHRSAILDVHGPERLSATITVHERTTGALVWADG